MSINSPMPTSVKDIEAYFSNLLAQKAPPTGVSIKSLWQEFTDHYSKETNPPTVPSVLSFFAKYATKEDFTEIEQKAFNTIARKNLALNPELILNEKPIIYNLAEFIDSPIVDAPSRILVSNLEIYNSILQGRSSIPEHKQLQEFAESKATILYSLLRQQNCFQSALSLCTILNHPGMDKFIKNPRKGFSVISDLTNAYEEHAFNPLFNPKSYNYSVDIADKLLLPNSDIEKTLSQLLKRYPNNNTTLNLLNAIGKYINDSNQPIERRRQLFIRTFKVLCNEIGYEKSTPEFYHAIYSHYIRYIVQDWQNVTSEIKNASILYPLKNTILSPAAINDDVLKDLITRILDNKTCQDMDNAGLSTLRWVITPGCQESCRL